MNSENFRLSMDTERLKTIVSAMTLAPIAVLVVDKHGKPRDEATIVYASETPRIGDLVSVGDQGTIRITQILFKAIEFQSGVPVLLPCAMGPIVDK